MHADLSQQLTLACLASFSQSETRTAQMSRDVLIFMSTAFFLWYHNHNSMKTRLQVHNSQKTVYRRVNTCFSCQKDCGNIWEEIFRDTECQSNFGFEDVDRGKESPESKWKCKRVSYLFIVKKLIIFSMCKWDGHLFLQVSNKHIFKRRIGVI